MLITHTIRSYFIHSNPLMFRDTPERIDYHIQSGDYLPLVATLMGFMEEALMNNDSSSANDRKNEMALKLARDLRKDLRYVSANYTLEPRDADNRLDLPSGNVLASG